MNTELTQDWYFTFGSDHKYHNRYVKINGTFVGAREEMFRRYKNKWAFQYDSIKAATIIEKYKLSAITVVEQLDDFGSND